MGFILELMAKAKGFDFAMICLYIIAFNLFIEGSKKAVDKIKDKTKSKLDNKLSNYLGKALSFSSKILDILGCNTSHKK